MADTNRLKKAGLNPGKPEELDPVAAAFWCFALAVALLPIGLGGNRPIPLGIAQMGLAISGLFLFLEQGFWRGFCLFTRLRWALGLFGAVLIWAFLQTQGFMPAGWDHPLWNEAAAVLGKPLQATIAIAPQESLAGMARLITTIACGFLAYALGQDAARARQLIRVIWYSGIVVCSYGILAYMSGNGAILWFQKWSYFNDLTATFVNRNHFAVYAGLVFLCGVALLIQSLREQVQKTRLEEQRQGLRRWLVQKGVPQAVMLGLVISCIILSHSRAGLILTLLAFGSYLFFFQIYIRAYRRAVLTGMLALAACVLVLIAAMATSERFAVLLQDYSSTDRLKVYGIVWQAMLDNLWLGYGLNGFQPVFRLYQPGMSMEFTHAHSDVLESLLDLGLIFGLLLWLAIALLLSGLFHGVLKRRRHGLFPTLGLASSVLVLGHALVDFSLQQPGVAFIWAALVGTGLAQSWGQSEKSTYLDRLQAEEGRRDEA